MLPNTLTQKLLQFVRCFLIFLFYRVAYRMLMRVRMSSSTRLLHETLFLIKHQFGKISNLLMLINRANFSFKTIFFLEIN